MDAERLHQILGAEKDQNEVARILRDLVREERPPVVGALHVTCSDDVEQEGVGAFQRGFGRYLMPAMKLSNHSVLQSVNLGARYEWGAAPTAERIYANASGAEKWKTLVVKIDAHVAPERTSSGVRCGHFARFGTDAACCRTVSAVLDGAPGDFADEIIEAYGFEGVDRLGVLRDPSAVDPDHRAFHAAVLGARLHARRAMIDVQEHRPASPTLYYILPCVSLNSSGHDSEIVCGIYACDRRGDDSREDGEEDAYCGVGDDPRRYRLKDGSGGLELHDPEIHQPRIARRHRALIDETWRTGPHHDPQPDSRLAAGFAEIVARPEHRHPVGEKLALAALLVLVSEVAPIPAALFLFGKGLVGVHHTAEAHRLAREAEDDAAALAMLEEIRGQVERMEPEQARHLTALLQGAFG